MSTSADGNGWSRFSLVLAWVLLALSLLGFIVTFPLWLLGIIDEQMMLGITLALSWASLWYAAFVAILEARRMHYGGAQ